MFSLIASISIDKIYQMDEHMFNWIEIAITILSIVIAVITIIMAIIGGISFNNMKKQINNSKEKINKELEEYSQVLSNQDEKLKEIEDLKECLNSEMMKMRQINAHIITNNIQIINYQLKESSNNKKNDMLLLDISNSLKGLIDTIPDKFSNVQQYKSFLVEIAYISSWISKIKLNETEVNKDRLNRIYNRVYILENKVPLEKINTKNMNKEDEKEIMKYLIIIRNSKKKINKLKKQLTDTK